MEESRRIISFHQNIFKPNMAELIGTALFTFLLNFSTHQSSMTILSFPLMSGLSLLVVRSIFYSISGAHFNPAVTLSQYSLRQTTGITVIPYIFMQIFGAFIGSALFRSLVSASVFEDNFVCYHLEEVDGQWKITRLQAFLLESFLTAVLCLIHDVEREDGELHKLSSTWTLITFISFPLMGFSSNFAVILSNSVVYHIFTGNGKYTHFIYLNAFSALLGIVISFLIFWVTKEFPVPRDSKIQNELSSVTQYNIQ